jgi:hypothetical protein
LAVVAAERLIISRSPRTRADAALAVLKSIAATRRIAPQR